MADAELHIIVKRAGDPEILGALVNAAVAMQERPQKIVVPNGYHCVECDYQDGGHAPNCSCAILTGEQRDETPEG